MGTQIKFVIIAPIRIHDARPRAPTRPRDYYFHILKAKPQRLLLLSHHPCPLPGAVVPDQAALSRVPQLPACTINHPKLA